MCPGPVVRLGPRLRVRGRFRGRLGARVRGWGWG